MFCFHEQHSNEGWTETRRPRASLVVSARPRRDNSPSFLCTSGASSARRGARGGAPALLVAMPRRAYDPDADPLMGRLVSVLVDEGDAGAVWKEGCVGYCETRWRGDVEESTGAYRVMWGRFATVDDALATKRKKVRGRTRRARPSARRAGPPRRTDANARD